MEKLRTNLKIIQINGTNLSKFGATTDGVCYMIKEELKDAKAKKITEQAFAIQEKAEQRAEKEAGLETWQKKQLVADVVVRELEILSGEKTFEQVYREELMYYRK
ncbi:hypothetical protein JXA56_04565 [Candidatus Micrarchaeota archaeon]|nr:hypothetical protein [Candidatus Micrarchaeota archaeon]